MTAIYDPKHPKYLDEADMRSEMDRIFDLCHGCRLCFKFCSSFPTLFEFVDQHDDQDASKLTKAEQDQVVDECFNCKLCYVNCPYIPGQHEWELDFPRLMLRAKAIQRETGSVSRKDRITDKVLGSTDLIGKVGSFTSPLANAATARPGSLMRKVMAKTVGISAERLLPPFARQRFSTWFKKRDRPQLGTRQAKVTLFPTCLVEYQNASIGHDLVKVYERNGVDVGLPDKVMCCGAPHLHAGDIAAFTKQATENIRALAPAARRGEPIVVPQPTCSYVLRKDYVDYVGGPDAEAVAAATYDTSEYLWKLHKDEGTSLDAEFTGDVPATITYHAPCHLRAQNIGLKSRDLLKLTGTKITVVAQCSGIDGMWGLRDGNEKLSKDVGRKLGAEIDRAGGEAIAGDCHLANGAIIEETGRIPYHPLQLLARAYGIQEEPQR